MCAGINASHTSVPSRTLRMGYLEAQEPEELERDGMGKRRVPVIDPVSERNPERPSHNPLRLSSSRLRRCPVLEP